MKSTLLIVLTLVCTVAYTQESDSVLTFKEAVDIALKNNLVLNQQRNNLNTSQANKLSNFAQLGPQASVNGSFGQRSGNTFIQQEARVVNATVYLANASFNAQMPIFGGFSGINFARQADSQLDAQVAFVQRSTQDVINTVAIQYLQVLLDRELLKIAEENVTLQKTIMDQVKAQVELGSRPPVDQYNQQAQLSNAELRVTQAEFSLVNDKMLLYQTLLIDPTVTRVIEEPAWDINAIALDNLTLDQLIQEAMTRRADLKQFQYTARASKYAMHANKGNFFPQLNAVYSNGSAWNKQKDAPVLRTFNDQFFTDNRSNYLGLNLNIPLFGAFQNRLNYVRSKTQYKNDELVAKNREVVVKADVVRAYENLESIKKAYSAGLTGLEASKVAHDLEKERYQLDVTSFVDMANANRTYIQAQTDMAQAKYRLLFQKILLDYAIGTLKPEDIPGQ